MDISKMFTIVNKNLALIQSKDIQLIHVKLLMDNNFPCKKQWHNYINTYI